jgi:hypothetical protein
MSIILIPNDAQPSKTDAGLDVLRRTFDTDSSYKDTMAAMPARYIADSAIPYDTTYACDPQIGASVYDTMYLMDIQVRESGIKLCQVDLIFHGSLTGDLPAPKHDTGSASQNAQFTETGVISFSIQFVAPTTALTYFSTAPVSSAGLPQFGHPTQNTYLITGTLNAVAGTNRVSGVGTSFLSQVVVGDQVHLIFDGTGTIKNGAAGTVTSIASDTSFFVDQISTSINNVLNPGPLTTFPSGLGTPIANGSFGFHLGNIPIQVTSIRVTEGAFGVLLVSGSAASLWGPIIIATYFATLVTPTYETKELVPGKYYQNVQRTNLSLLPLIA